MSSRRRRREGPGPFTAAGLIRFYEEVEEGIKMKPYMIVIIAFTLIAVVIALNFIKPIPLP